MKYPDRKPSLVVMKGAALSLSKDALSELLTAVLDRGVPFRFLAKGSSMSPFIKNGDIVTISPLTTRQARMGEIVAFIHPQSQSVCVHRVIGAKSGCYWIQGDSIDAADGFIKKQQVLGFVEKVERRGKKVSFGLGPERLLIAFLHRKGLYLRLYQGFYRIFHLFRPPSDTRHQPHGEKMD